MQTSGVRVLGLYGMGGIGKSTLATALFDTLSQSGFHRSLFVPDIRDRIGQQDGAENLQHTILDRLGSRDMKPLSAVDGECLHITARDAHLVQQAKIVGMHAGKREIGDYLHDKAVLLVLDDIGAFAHGHVDKLLDLRKLGEHVAIVALPNVHVHKG